MKKWMIILFSFLFAVTVSVADDRVAPEFSLMGTDGETHSLQDYSDASAVVVMFIATRCPISNGFNERMVELANEYLDNNIVFLGINSNKLEKMGEMKKHAVKHNFPFVVLKDENNIVADEYKAQVTPEVFVVDSARHVLYHGRIDDSSKVSERKSEDLKAALDAIISGEEISVSETKAFGCTIKRVEK